MLQTDCDFLQHIIQNYSRIHYNNNSYPEPH